MKNIKIAIFNIKKNFKNAKELKSTFITSIVGMCINNISFIILWYYFGKMVGDINGWTAIDIFGLYGFSATNFGIVDSLFNGLYNIPSNISTGNLDKYLTTPKSTLVKLITSSVSTSGLGDFLFGIICFIIYAIISKLTLFQIFISIILMILSSIIFFSFSLICMSVSFYLMDGENVSIGLYQMFVSVSLYHGGAFSGILKKIFVFIVPSLLLGAIPVEIVKNITITNIGFILLLTLFWLVLSITIFNKSLKKYESNNFYGFGG